MSKNKAKKLIQFWGQFKNTPIAKGAAEQAKKVERAYNRHRAKSKAK